MKNWRHWRSTSVDCVTKNIGAWDACHITFHVVLKAPTNVNSVVKSICSRKTLIYIKRNCIGKWVLGVCMMLQSSKFSCNTSALKFCISSCNFVCVCANACMRVGVGSYACDFLQNHTRQMLWENLKVGSDYVLLLLFPSY